MNLLKRVASGAVLIAIVVAALWIGGVAVAVLIGIAALAGAWEFSGLAAKLGAPPQLWLLYPLTLWWAVRFYLPGGFNATDAGLAAALVIGLLGAVIVRATTLRWAATVAGAAYIGLGLGYFGGLLTTAWRWQGSGCPTYPAAQCAAPWFAGHLGLGLVILALVAPIAGDTAAYFAGSAFGRHRFFPSVSPKKSVEGAVAAAVIVVVAEALLAPLLAGMAWWQGAILGAVATVAAQGGDLAESKLKREAQVKDSSRLIPGHGGLLDRLDSLLLVAPVVYWFAKMTGLA